MITRLPVRLLSSSAIFRPGVQYLPRCRKISETPLHVLRCKYQQAYSTSSPPPPPSAEPSKPIDLRSQLSGAPIQPQSPKPKRKRSLRRYIYAILFLLLGSTVGRYARLVIAPPPLPEPGSREDIFMVSWIKGQAEKLPIVQSLSTDPNWTSYDAYSSVPEDQLRVRLTSGPLAGARAIGAFQRIFYNKESGEIMTVIWFGGSIQGFPGVVHGGITSTIMDEVLGRCAVKNFPAKTGVTANLEVNFLKPVVTMAFYVVRAVPQLEGQTDRKGWVTGRLETLEGRVCVEAKSLYVVPKKYETRQLENF